MVLPLAGLDLGNAKVKNLSLGPPWRLERHPGQPLNTLLSGDELSIEVPEALEGWSKLPPCFFVEATDGRFSMVTVGVREIFFDDSDLSGDLQRARGRQGLLYRTVTQLRAALAEPVEAPALASAALRDARAQLAATEQRIDELNLALRRATPEQRTFAALLVAEHGQPLVQLHNTLLEAEGQLAHLRDNLATMTGLAPRSELAAAEAEVARAESSAAQLRTGLGVAVDAVIHAASAEQLASRASQVLGGEWAPWGAQYAADVSDAAFWQGVVQSQEGDAHEARSLVRQHLEAVEAQLVEGQRTIDGLSERLRARDVP